MKSAELVISFIVLLSGVAPSQERATPHEQLSFEIGHGRSTVKHPVPLSDADLAEIRKVQSNQPLFQPPFPLKSSEIPVPTREGLEVGAVHLNGPEERDLVVIGSGRRYVTEKLAPFWVIREIPTGPKVVLAEWTHKLEVQPTKHRGMADLLTYRDTGMGGSVTAFEFNGFKYAQMIEVIN